MLDLTAWTIGVTNAALNVVTALLVAYVGRILKLLLVEVRREQEKVEADLEALRKLKN